MATHDEDEQTTGTTGATDKGEKAANKPAKKAADPYANDPINAKQLRVENLENGNVMKVSKAAFLGMQDDTFGPMGEEKRRYKVIEGTPLKKPAKKGNV